MSAWRDPDTKDMNCVWQLGGEVEKEVEAEITISIEYTGEIPDQCQIASIEFNSKDIFIEVDEDDLARIGEDENIDDFSNHFDTE
jgi:YbbR domain-containing protein